MKYGASYDACPYWRFLALQLLQSSDKAPTHVDVKNDVDYMLKVETVPTHA